MQLFCQQGLYRSSEDGCMLLCQGCVQELEEDFSAAVQLLQLLSGEGEQSQGLKPL